MKYYWLILSIIILSKEFFLAYYDEINGIKQFLNLVFYDAKVIIVFKHSITIYSYCWLLFNSSIIEAHKFINLSFILISYFFLLGGLILL